MINAQVLKGNLIMQDYTTAFTLSQGDKGVPFRVELLENGTPYTLLDSDIVYIEWLKPNGSPFLQEGNIKYGTNYIDFTTPEAVAQYAGNGSFNVIISNGDVRKGTIRREYKVVPTSMKPGSVSEDVITDAITELRNLNTELAEKVQNNQEIINSNSAATKQDIANVNSSLEENMNELQNKGIDVTFPFPTGLQAAKGDGVTDDTNAIQSIIDYAFDNGINRVYLPARTFKISQLKLKRGITLVGAGLYSTFLSGIEETDMIVLYDETSAYCQVENLFIHGNNIANRGIFAYKSVYTLQYLDNSFVAKNILIKGCNVAGVQLGKEDTASIMECRLINVTVNQCNGKGIYLTKKCTDSYFVNCTAATCLQGGIVVEGFNLKLLNCKTYFNGTVDNPYSGFILNNCSLDMFSNCEAQDNYKHGFELNNCQNIGLNNVLCDRNGNGGLDDTGEFVAPTTPLYSGVCLTNCRRINVNGVFTNSNYLTLKKHTQLSAVALDGSTNININIQADTHPYYISETSTTKGSNHFIDEIINGCGYIDITPPFTFTSPTTVNGITFTKINENTISVNGTATSDAKLTLFGTWGSLDKVINIPDNTRLKVGTTLRNTNGGNVFFTVVKDSTNVIVSTNQDHYENVPTSYAINQLGLKVTSGTIVNNELIQPKLMIKQMTLKGEYDS